MNVRLGRNEQLANSFCEVFTPNHGIPLEVLNEYQLKKILFKLTKINELEDHLYYLNQYILYCSKRIPKELFDLLLKRLDIYVAQHKFMNILYKIESKTKISIVKYYNDVYRPFPLLGFHQSLNSIASYKEYSTLLRIVRDRYLKMDYNSWLNKLFSEISCNYCPISIDVLEKWLNSNDAKKIEAVGYFLEEAESEFLFSHIDFISRILEKANQISEECFQNVKSSLFHMATSGGKHGTLGQPYPEDIQLKDLYKLK
jgi:hypothetical protein